MATGCIYDFYKLGTDVYGVAQSHQERNTAKIQQGTILPTFRSKAMPNL